MEEYGRSFLVTGGAGMIGSHIVDKLLQSNIYKNIKKIVVIDNLSKGFKRNINTDPRVEFINTDIGTQNIEKYFEGIDYVFHQSAYRIIRCAERHEEAVRSMGLGAVEIWKSALKHGVKKIVFASSASVYGQAQQFPTRIDHHLNNCDTLYGGLKFLTECLARSFGVPYVGLRYHNIYGPRMDGNGKYSEVFIKWYEAIKSGKKPLVNGSGTLDLVYCEDVAEANIAALNAPDGVYNISSGAFTYLSEIADCIGLKMGDLGYNYDGYELMTTDNRSYHRWGDDNTSWWTAKTSLEDGISKFVDYMETVNVECMETVK